jgi:hypothetical protein
VREEKPVRKCETSFVRAANTSQHILAKAGTTIDIRGLHLDQQIDEKPFKAAQHMLKQQPELQWLPTKLESYWRSQGLSMTNDLICVKLSGTLSATPTSAEGDHDVLQPIHSTPKHNDRPWFDSVRVRNDDGSSWYGEVRMMFEFCRQQLFYVRWYDVVQPPPHDILSQYGCVYLKLLDMCDVISLESVLSREYIVPDYRTSKLEGGKVIFDGYHVSVFKWERSSVGFKADAVDEHGKVIP